MQRVAPVFVGQREVFGRLLPLHAGEFLQEHEPRLGVALEAHNPSEGPELVAVEGDDLSHLDGAVDILAPRPDDAVGLGVEEIDVDPWFVEAH